MANSANDNMMTSHAPALPSIPTDTQLRRLQQHCKFPAGVPAASSFLRNFYLRNCNQRKRFPSLWRDVENDV